LPAPCGRDPSIGRWDWHGGCSFGSGMAHAAVRGAATAKLAGRGVPVAKGGSIMTGRVPLRKGFVLALPAAALALSAALLTAGCHSEASANQDPTVMSTKEAKMAIGEVSVGHQVAADGLITGDQKGGNFTAGQPVVIAFRIGRAPVGALVHVN